MKTIRNPICKTIMLIALPAGILVSCDSKKSDGAGAKEKAPSEVVIEPKAEPRGMPLEEFNRQFLDILSQKDLMQSALTNKVSKLSEQLNLKLLEQMLEQAADNPPDGISEDHWLLGYNQLMALAGMRLGGDATALFYKLAANKTASSVMRDYASQHYLRTESRVLIQLHASTDKETSRAHLQQILNKAGSLVVGADKADGTLPGTTLLGLAALSMPYEKYPDEFALIRDKVTQLTMPILENRINYDDLTVSAAMQAASRLSAQGAGPHIWEVAMDKSEETNIRLSAIGSLRGYRDLVNIDELRDSVSRRDKLLKRAIDILAQNNTINNKYISK